jgi:ATP-dependent exoDNAse (exonuclease V) alpha subunit
VYGWLEGQGKDLTNDVQVLCSRNETRKKLNPLLGDRLNANPPGEHPVFRKGDKIICLRNDFLTTATGPGSGETAFVANGDFGTVEAFSGARMVIELSSPFRRVLQPLMRGKGQSGEDTGDENDVMGKNGCRWDLGYCVTGHKSQGSEWRVVVVVLDAAGLLSCREWLYTAISRAKGLCVLVGPRSQISRHINRSAIPDRKTFLVDLLKGNQP